MTPTDYPKIDFPKKEDMDRAVALALLTSATDANGESFYIYMQISPSKYAEYLQAMEKGVQIDYTKFGTILKTGKGYPPPENVMKEMEKLGFNHNLEKELPAAIEKEIKFLEEKGITTLDEYVKAKIRQQRIPEPRKSFLPLRDKPEE